MMRIILVRSLILVVNANMIAKKIGGRKMKPVRMFIMNLDRKNRTALVKSYKTGEMFPVDMRFKEAWKYECVQRGDDGLIVKSGVTGEWLMIDYSFYNSFNYALHNQEQERYEDMICNENGVPFDF